MAKYLLFESHDSVRKQHLGTPVRSGGDLVEEGNDVTLFLVQNGVLPSRPGDRSALLTNSAQAGIEVLADAFSLRERGISAGKLAGGVRPAPLSVVIDQLAKGRKAIWH